MQSKPAQVFSPMLCQTWFTTTYTEKNQNEPVVLFCHVFIHTSISAVLTMMDLNSKTNSSAAAEAFRDIYLPLFISCDCSGISHLPTLLLLSCSSALQETVRAVSLSPGWRRASWSCSVCCHRRLTRTLRSPAAQQPFDTDARALCVCSAVRSTFLPELSGCLHWLPSYTHRNVSAAPPSPASPGFWNGCGACIGHTIYGMYCLWAPTRPRITGPSIYINLYSIYR